MALRRNRQPDEPVHASGRTLVQVVDEYLAELDNPAPDYQMRQIYREWMAELVEMHREQELAT